MKQQLPEQFRIREGRFATKNDSSDGAFLIPCLEGRAENTRYLVFISRVEKWEHARIWLYDKKQQRSLKVHLKANELRHIRSLFWGEETTLLFYPPAELYKQPETDFSEHLWRYTEAEGLLPIPHPIIAEIFGYEMGRGGLEKIHPEVSKKVREQIITQGWSPKGRLVKK